MEAVIEPRQLLALAKTNAKVPTHRGREFSEALDEHLQEVLQIEVVECRPPRPRQCREVFGERNA